MLLNQSSSSCMPTQISHGDEGSQILEMEELTVMEIWRLDQLGNSFLILWLGPGPLQIGLARVLPPAENQSIGGGVSPYSRRSTWMVTNSWWTCEIVQACMRVVSLFSICIQQPGSSALNVGYDPTVFSCMYGSGCRMVPEGAQQYVTDNLILTSWRRLCFLPNIFPLTSTLDNTHTSVQPCSFYHILILPSAGICTVTVIQ